MIPMTDSLILYHADCDDGFGAAYAAWLSLGDGAEYQPVYYGDQIVAERLTGRQVFILDFSFSPDVLRTMAQHAANIVLLDHHKSAAEQWADVEPIANVDLQFDMDRSGAQIAWDYFHSGSVRPPLIDHIGDRDLWRFALKDTKAFCAGLSLIPMSFASWQDAATHPEELIAKGHTVLEVLQRQIDSALRKDLRSVTLCGHQGLATNAISNTSEIGQAIAKRSGTFSLTFFIKGDMVICSLRSIAPFDVSGIATHFGGGGHAQASGFTISIERFFSEIWNG
jgi:oligoribonuclease NrnB/cAMP/cGMP phosphodiesterase (DHH superfamily)